MILSLTAIDLNTKQDYISKLCICLYSFLKHNSRYIGKVHVFSNNRKFNELIEAICVKFDVQLEYCEVELKIDTIPKVYKIENILKSFTSTLDVLYLDVDSITLTDFVGDFKT